MKKLFFAFFLISVFFCMAISTQAAEKIDTPETPAPTLKCIDVGKITLNEIEGCEYSSDGVNWQKDPSFFGLLSGEDYTFYQRYVNNGQVSIGRKMRLYYLGDVNQDGAVNAQDSTLLAKWLAHWNVSLTDEDAADIDCNDIVDDWDSILLERYLAGWNIDLKPQVKCESFITYENTNSAPNSNPNKYFCEDGNIPLQDLSVEGYVFEGWYNGSSKITTLTENIIEDTVLTAHWTPIDYPVTYENTKGVSHANPTFYTVESNGIPLQPLSQEDLNGYIFEGWYLNGSKVTAIPADSIGPVTLTAKWTPISYTITYENAKNAVHSNPVTYTVEDNIQLELPSIPGYNCEGWYTGTEKITDVSNCTGNLVLTAKWELQSYTITYENTKGVAHQLPTTYTIESESIILENLEKVGYIFNGWTLNELTTPSIPSGSYGNITLTAQWTPIAYTITYSGWGTHTNPTRYTLDDGIITLKKATRTGYRFLGWYEDETQITTIDPQRMENISLTAKWTEATTIIKFDYNGGAGNQQDVVVTYGKRVPEITGDIPIKVGYVFLGYHYNNKKYYDASLNTCPYSVSHGEWADPYWSSSAETVTFTAKWELADWDSFDPESSIQQTCNTTSSTTTYHFMAGTKGQHLWQIELVDYTMMVTLKDKNNKTIYENTVSRTTNITLNLNPGEIYYVSAKSWWSGTNTTSSANQKARYRILTHDGINIVLLEGSHSNCDLFKINYLNTKGASNPNPTEFCEYSILINDYSLTPISKEGYIFHGWYLDNVKVTTLAWSDFHYSDNYNVIYRDVSLTAKMTPINYQATFVLNGETVGSCTFNMDDSFIKNSPEPPQREHYTVAWKYTLKPENMVISEYVYTPINYDITYSGMGNGTHPNTTTYNIETGVSLADATRPHYIFNGWYLNGKKVTEIPVGTTGDITLTASWTAKVYTITFMSNYGEAPASIQYTVEHLPNLPNMDKIIINNQYYYFYGWYDERSFISKITENNMGDKTLVAYWAPENPHITPFNYIVEQSGYITNVKTTGTAIWDDRRKCYYVTVSVSATLNADAHMSGYVYMDKLCFSYSMHGLSGGYVTGSDYLDAEDYLIH